MTTQTGLPFLALDDKAKEPLYRQIYARFRDAIAQSTLKPGDRVPAVRGLAAELGLARGTVEMAYDLLVAEGYFESRGQAGTVVAPHLGAHSTALPPLTRAPRPPASHPALATPAAEAGANRSAALPGTSERPLARVTPLPFQLGVPAFDAFPRKTWARLGARCLRSAAVPEMHYPNPAGDPALRTAVAAYLQVSRGIACTPAQVFVTTGYLHTLELICRTLLTPGDKVWVEDPGYPPTRTLMRSAGATLTPVPVDAEGIVVAHGVAAAPDARLAVVTPSHQSPLSLSLSLPRRLALLDWATQHGAWLVEDDYDGEYRYIGRPLPALKSLDRDGRVLYAGSFSKVLFPAIRLGYLVVPEPLVPAIEQTCRAFHSGCPQLIQGVVAAFMAEGHFARHIKKMRTLYASRRAATVEGLTNMLGARIDIADQPGGMHLQVRLNGTAPDHAVAARMRANGLYAQAVSDWMIGEDRPQALLLGFTNIESRAIAEGLARRMAPLL